MPTSRPPYSAGQLTTDHRSSYSSRSQARCCSKPSAVSSEARAPGAGAWASSQARASARKASSAGEKVRSMPARIWHTVRYSATMASMPNAVIVDAVRTPVGRRGGRLSGWHAVDLAAQPLLALVERNDLDPALVEDVIMGCTMTVGEQAMNIARNAALAAGFPDTVPGTTVDRQCGSAQQAVHFAAQAVMAGAMDVVIGGGVESMTGCRSGRPPTRARRGLRPDVPASTSSSSTRASAPRRSPGAGS